MNIVAIIQARLGSTRLPKKVFADLAGKPLIWHVINRLKYSDRINNIVLATTNSTTDDDLANWANIEHVNLFRGSENNVLERFYFAAKQYSADIIVRITADDPFKDPTIIDKVIDTLLDENLDFAYNNNPPTFPEGLDTEVFTYDAIEKAYFQSNDDYEKEHVTQYFYRNNEVFKQSNFRNVNDISNLRWTIDTELDYEMTKQVYNVLYREDSIFQMNDILRLLDEKPEISLINLDVARSAMYK
jgi:spore coat polysaccharide biosynthesis protein SpsF